MMAGCIPFSCKLLAAFRHILHGSEPFFSSLLCMSGLYFLPRHACQSTNFLVTILQACNAIPLFVCSCNHILQTQQLSTMLDPDAAAAFNSIC